MAIRRWAVRPDVVDERSGLEFVSRESMGGAWADADAIIARAGGVLTVVVDRAPTEIPGEMVTVGAIFEWKDRTDAKEQPERPAPPGVVLEPPPVPAGHTTDPLGLDALAAELGVSREELTARLLGGTNGADAPADVPAADPEQPTPASADDEEEDLSSIPPSMR